MVDCLPIDETWLARRFEVARALAAIVSEDHVVCDEVGLAVFECDALTAYRQRPLVAVLPATANEVASILSYCHGHGLKVVARGAGTSLSGGSLPLGDGVLLVLSRMNRILDMDIENRCLTAQPGVTNLAVSAAVSDLGLYYAPDPSSQIACTLGGNVAENAGGVHCLKYGLTSNNLMGLEIVLITGETLRIGGRHLDTSGYDLLGLVAGSEGMLGVVTEVTVRLLPKPASVGAMMIGFPKVRAAARCVADIISAGIIPAGMEMMDRPAIHAAEAFCAAGYPLDAEALLIVELDGTATDVSLLSQRVQRLATDNGASSCHVAQDAAERLRFWAGRKAAFPAIGRLSPDYLCMDGTIPRRHLPEVLEEIARLASQYGLAVANVFHAGDGNLHPLIMYNGQQPGEFERAESLGADILKLCVSHGGVLTGEHGVGIEKRDLMPVMFTETELDQQRRLKHAFDERDLLNPGKVFPLLRRCAEDGRVHVHAGQMRFPELPRF